MTKEYFHATNGSGHIRSDDADYATARGASTGDQKTNVPSVRNSFGTPVGGQYTVERGFLTFDTSSLPDAANITAVTILLFLGNPSKTETDAGQGTLHVVQGTHNDPIVLGDFDLVSDVSGGSKDNADLVGTGDGETITTIDLNATGIGWINKTGITKLALRTAGDINASTPTGGNIALFTNIQNGTVPRVFTEAVTNITDGEATLNGQVVAIHPIGMEVTYDGDDSNLPRGRFAYRKNAFPTSGSAATPWQEILSLSQVIEAKVTGLDEDSLYWVKMRAENQNGTTDPVGPTEHVSFNTLEDTDLIRVTAQVIHWSAGPNAVYEEELLTGGLFSQYFSPTGPREPEPTLRGPARDILSKMVPTLREYGQWLGSHTQAEQRAILRGIPGADVLTLRVWQEWVVGRRRMGQDI